jgi:glycine betaine catabolism A
MVGIIIAYTSPEIRRFAGARMHDPRRILDLLCSSEPGYTLPQAFYADPDLYDFDVSAVIGRSWLMIGFEAELPEPGSHIALTIGGSPILVARGRDGVIRGFHNSCRHRGSQICADGYGRSMKLICPYHKWTYELDGRLIGAARMPAGFRAEDHALVPVRIELLAGCIYAALTHDAPDFSPFRTAVAPLLAPYHLNDAKVAFQSSLIEKANWKLVMENARECYHCAASHPELKFSYPITYGSAALGKGNEEHERQFAARMGRLGLSTTPVEGTWWHAERYPLNPGMESISIDGRPVVSRRLIGMEEPEIGGLWWAIEPNTFCHALSDYAFTFTAIPVGPQETRVDSKWLVHKDAVEGIDFTIERLTETWTKTNLQDRELAENNQRGVNGRGYMPGPYSQDEDFVVRFGNWYRGMVRSAAEGVRPT